MLNLIIKDVAIQRRTLLMGFVYIAIMVLAFGRGGPAVFTAGTFAVSFLLMQTPCAHDEKSRAEAMLNSLPIKRGTIVNAKYLSVLLYVLIAMLEYMVVYAAVLLSGLPLKVVPLTLQNVVGLIATVAVFASIFYPIFFRFGYMRTRYINVFLFAGLFGAGSVLSLASGGNTGWQAAKGFMDAISSQPSWLVASGVLGIALGIVMVSYLLSLRFYDRREF